MKPFAAYQDSAATSFAPAYGVQPPVQQGVGQAVPPVHRVDRNRVDGGAQHGTVDGERQVEDGDDLARVYGHRLDRVVLVPPGRPHVVVVAGVQEDNCPARFVLGRYARVSTSADQRVQAGADGGVGGLAYNVAVR